MSKFMIQHEKKKEVREKEKTSRETLGRYFYDLSKLTFGAMVLGIVIPWLSELDNPDYLVIFGIGIFSTIMLAISGYKVIKR